MPNHIIQRARTLRNNPTAAEKYLWQHLKRRQLNGLKFRGQVPLDRYVLDFVSFDARLVIEVDGSQHAATIHYDEERTRFLETRGFLVLRFWNNEVLENIEGVMCVIGESVNPHPDPPPEGEGIS